MLSSPDAMLVAFLALTLAQLVLLNLAVLLAQRGRTRPGRRFVLGTAKGQE